MIPVFKIQGAIAAGGMSGLELRDTLVRVADISHKLMEANSKMVQHLAKETFDLLQTPLYDPERAAKVEEELREYRTQLNQMKVEWADTQKRLTEKPQDPHYARVE